VSPAHGAKTGFGVRRSIVVAPFSASGEMAFDPNPVLSAASIAHVLELACLEARTAVAY
jgi:hypothetical protein